MGRFEPTFYFNCEHFLFVYVVKQKQTKSLLDKNKQTDKEKRGGGSVHYCSYYEVFNQLGRMSEKIESQEQSVLTNVYFVIITNISTNFILKRNNL